MSDQSNFPLEAVFSKPLRSVHILRHVIAHYREKEGFRQEDLAEKLGIFTADVKRMEEGDFSSISAQTLFDVLMALRIDLNIAERKRPTAVDIERESYARRFRPRETS